METNNFNKPSQVMAWLGFGISLGVFILVWIVNLVILSNIDNSGFHNFPFASFTILLIFIWVVGGLLGILGFIFSIIGLVSANKYSQSKVPGVWGIILCCATLLSAFVPIIYTFSKIDHTLGENTGFFSSSKERDENSNVDDVVIYVEGFGNVKCYKPADDNPVNMSALTSSSFKREFKTWLKTNGYDENVSIVIKQDKDTNYSDVANVVEALNELGMKNFTIQDP